jgi:hypothetical protein
MGSSNVLAAGQKTQKTQLVLKEEKSDG